VNAGTVDPLGIACSATGTGEHIIKSILCRSAWESFISCDHTDKAMQQIFEDRLLSRLIFMLIILSINLTSFVFRFLLS
jgi:isoaspartyl peptidase/L-asparaginase-like protein (Ntn-hydrolase superfamily)